MAVRNAELNNSEVRKSSYRQGNFSHVREPLYNPKEAPSRSPHRKQKSERVKKDLQEYHPVPTTRSLSILEIKVVTLTIIIVTAILLGIIFIAAQAAVIQKEINDLNNDITQIDEDIISIKVNIEQAKNIQSIGAKAKDSLGMKEPSFDQYVYINELEPIEGSFIDFIKGKINGSAEEE